MINIKKLYASYKRFNWNPPECPVCRRAIYESDLDDCEYVETKRHTKIFIHTQCVNKWGE